MPSSVTILCQIKSKGLDGRFINRLVSYIIEPENSKLFIIDFTKNKYLYFYMI